MTFRFFYKALKSFAQTNGRERDPLGTPSISIRSSHDFQSFQHLSPPNIPLRLIADKEQVEQVLINLIRNARENEATQITLSAGITLGNHLFLRVTDNGTGIDPEVQERIFIPFFTTKPTGSGIGLTISRQIMHQHHGSITVQSKVGEGSTFTLLFPIV